MYNLIFAPSGSEGGAFYQLLSSVRAEVLTDLKIYPISFSKYGTCYQKNLADGNINDTTETSEISETSETKNRAHISGGKKLWEMFMFKKGERYININLR